MQGFRYTAGMLEVCRLVEQCEREGKIPTARELAEHVGGCKRSMVMRMQRAVAAGALTSELDRAPKTGTDRYTFRLTDLGRALIANNADVETPSGADA